MNTSRLGAIVFLLLLLTSEALFAGEVKITFAAKVPDTTPVDAKIYLTGDAKSLSEWKPAGVELTRGDDGTWSAVVSLERDQQIEYKLTRGSWETVEKNADGSEMSNRTLTPTREARVEITVLAWGTGAATQPTTNPSTRTGDIRVHPNVHSRNLNNDREILVWLPPGYDTDKDRRYPVLYMHDGQNVFDAAMSFAGEWRADETAAKLIQEKKVEPIIIVAVANTSARMDEYTLDRSKDRDSGGKGDAYIKFLVEEVKPLIDSTYRTKTDRADTAIAGSSLGGLISIEACRTQPSVFGGCAALSPSLWWTDGALLKRLTSDHDWMKNCRVWIDTGSAEGKSMDAGNFVDDVRTVEALLKQTGGSFKVIVVEGGKHNEAAWADRFGQVLEFLFPL